MDHLELKGLEGQIPTGDPRVGILHAVEPLQGRVVRTESELLSQEIIAEGENGPPDCQTLLFNGAVHRLSLRELATDVQHRPALHPLSPGPGQLPAPCPMRLSAARRGEKNQENARVARHTEQPLPG